MLAQPLPSRQPSRRLETEIFQGFAWLSVAPKTNNSIEMILPPSTHPALGIDLYLFVILHDWLCSIENSNYVTTDFNDAPWDAKMLRGCPWGNVLGRYAQLMLN